MFGRRTIRESSSALFSWDVLSRSDDFALSEATSAFTASASALAANIADIAGRSNDMAAMSEKLIDVIKAFK